MRDGNSKKSKFSWPKTLVKKWLNIKSKTEDFHADDIISGGVDEEWRNNFRERGRHALSRKAKQVQNQATEKPNRRTTDRVRRSKIDLDASQLTDVNNYRYAVSEPEELVKEFQSLAKGGKLDGN